MVCVCIIRPKVLHQSAPEDECIAGVESLAVAQAKTSAERERHSKQRRDH